MAQSFEDKARAMLAKITEREIFLGKVTDFIAEVCQKKGVLHEREEPCLHWTRKIWDVEDVRGFHLRFETYYANKFDSKSAGEGSVTIFTKEGNQTKILL